MGYSTNMKLFIFTLLFMSWSFVIAETVYKTIDEDGNIIFSDQPSHDAEVIHLQELQTIDNPNAAKFPPGNINRQMPDLSSNYQAFSIVSPAAGEGYRSNGGSVTIQLSLQPRLSNGHFVVIKLDGQEVAKGRELSASVQDVARGAHSITAAVVDSRGNTMISTSSSFNMLRVSLGTP